MSIDQNKLKHIVEAVLLVSGKPQSLAQLQALFEGDEDAPDKKALQTALTELAADFDGRGIELKEVANGYRIQAKQELEPWVSRLFQEKAPRYSRALLETLALVAYRQPVTRSEIEEVRGVSVSSYIMKTLMERDWIKVVGHKEVPGRPAMFATTKEFLDYFNLKGLEELPTLQELKDLDKLGESLSFPSMEEEAPKSEAGETSESTEDEARVASATPPDAEQEPADEDVNTSSLSKDPTHESSDTLH